MRRIESVETFREVLTAKRAILALHATWSMPSVIVQAVINDWERQQATSVSEVAVFVAETMPDIYHPVVVAWLEANHLGHLAFRGSGEVLWLECGRIISLEQTVTNVGFATRTHELWQG